MSGGITMAGKGFDMGLKKSDLELLEKARVQLDKVRAARARCNVIVPNGRYRSPAFDGVPGGGAACGLDGSKEACEEALANLEREERIMRELKKKGERAIEKSGLDAKIREFCRMLYLEGKGVKEAAECLGVSEATGWRYKAKILRRKTRKNQDDARKKRA